MFIVIDPSDLAKIDLAEAIEDHALTQVVDFRLGHRLKGSDFPHGLSQALTEESGSLYHYWADDWEGSEADDDSLEKLAEQLLNEPLLGACLLILPAPLFRNHAVTTFVACLRRNSQTVKILTDQGLLTFEEQEIERTGGQLALFEPDRESDLFRSR
ncbi:MAG: hypothetical protein MUC92_12990 [Fimbriimonadaceae bacterium]|jgi:hypothetical protein|nr:hypothetical protein [Fimbriimonadaceae bacterium]